MADTVEITHPDEELFDEAGATKRDLIDYLEAIADRMVPELAGRPLSVIRVRAGQDPFMQKNLPKYAPDWIATAKVWAERSRREVTYGVCDDERTLIWFGNQRAVEYHPTLVRYEDPDSPITMVMDLDPPEGSGFEVVTAVAHLVHRALDEIGMAGAVKTSGSKGVHVIIPVRAGTSIEEVAAATRALAARAERLDPELATTEFVKDRREGKVFLDSTRAGGATVVAAYSPRIRPGVPVSFPVAWDELDGIVPGDFTVGTAVEALRVRPDWASLLPEPQPLDAGLVEEGRGIPIARVQAMHEGKRRARARRADSEGT
ncbi:MAG TPA: non-homologous end-joining DNA ligase [Mycobacteriales bacterium]|jgi:DNA ligase D|nr:non-homologous end-joining DNA ligase [Mycobacteriales bacterium]